MKDTPNAEMDKSPKKHIENILAIICFASMCLPIIFLNKHHDCRYDDECLKIWHDGYLGICVEKAIDNICVAIAVMWWFIIYGSSLVLNKEKNALSPFVIIGLVFALAFFLAFVDPSKWKFVIALFVSMALFITCVFFDSKKGKKHL